MPLPSPSRTFGSNARQWPKCQATHEASFASRRPPSPPTCLPLLHSECAPRSCYGACVCTRAHLGGPAFVNPATPLSNSGTGHSNGQSWTAATTPSLHLDSTLASFMLTCWPRVHGTDLVCMPSTQLCTATTAADLLPHFWTHTVCVFDTKRGSPPRVPVLAKPFVGPGSGPPPGAVPPRKPRGHQGGGPRAGGAGRGGGGAGGGAGASPAP